MTNQEVEKEMAKAIEPDLKIIEDPLSVVGLQKQPDYLEIESASKLEETKEQGV